MLKKHKQNQIVAPVVIFGIITAVVFSFLFFNTRPEYVEITSKDGAITIAGDFPSNINVNVQLDEGASSQEWTSAVENIYIIEPDGVVLPAPVAIRFPLRAREDSLAFNVGFFDTNRGVWVPVDTVRDEALEYFEAKTSHFSSWTLLEMPNIQIGEVDKEALIKSALAGFPPGAESFNVDLAYATVNGDYVMTEESALAGKCSDRSTVRGNAITTMTDRVARIQIEGVEKPAYIRAIVRWGVGSGCADLISEEYK